MYPAIPSSWQNGLPLSIGDAQVTGWVPFANNAPTTKLELSILLYQKKNGTAQQLSYLHKHFVGLLRKSSPQNQVFKIVWEEFLEKKGSSST